MSDNQKNESSTQGQSSNPQQEQSNTPQQEQSNTPQQQKVKNDPAPIKFEKTVHLKNDGADS